MIHSRISKYIQLWSRKIFKLTKGDSFIIVIFYSLSYVILLINDGIFWDDWMIFNTSKQNVIYMYVSHGDHWFGYFINFIFSISKGVFLFRLIIFLSYLFSAKFLYNLIKDIKEIDEFSRLIITLFFVLFPVTFARISISTVNYAVCYFLFFLAFWLVSKYMKNREIWLRISSFLLFFISFFMNSLLVFYYLVIIYIFYYEKEKIKSIRAFFIKSLNYIDFLILPVIFWAFKIVFLKTSSVFSQYNIVTLKSLLLASFKMVTVFNTSFLQPLNQTFAIFLRYPIEILILTLMATLLLKNKIGIQERNKNDGWFLLFGFIAFLAGVFPYLAVGLTLSIFDWESSHQILVPLGASFMLYYGIKILIGDLKLNLYIQRFIYSFCIAIFIATNFLIYLEYQKDWFKQLSLMGNFKNSEILRDNTTFLFDDRTTELDARRREYRFYEYTGLMKHIFNDGRRFGTKIENAPKDFIFITNIEKTFPNIKYILYELCNISNYTINQPEYKIIINYGSYPLNNHTVIKLILLRIIKPISFREKIENVVKLEYLKL